MFEIYFKPGSIQFLEHQIKDKDILSQDAKQHLTRQALIVDS